MSTSIQTGTGITLGKLFRNRLIGIFLMVAALYIGLMAYDSNSRSWSNQQSVLRQTGFQGILALGAGILIISGGIDLSMGSVLGLSAICFGVLLEKDVPYPVAMLLVLGAAPLIGLGNGLLVTKLRLQPFLVTLCGLFVYRGLARWVSWTPGGSARTVSITRIESIQPLADFMALQNTLAVPNFFWLMLLLAALMVVFLHGSVIGRYLFAIGANEQAARYMGIASDRYRILAYMICSFTAGLCGILFMFEQGGATPTDVGNWAELYAITGAVLGGCSLRGGDGTIAGIVLGAATLPLLRKFCYFYRIPDDLIVTVVGVALLLGTIADEVLKRRSGRGPLSTTLGGSSARGETAIA